jgi:hypothetical protein
MCVRLCTYPVIILHFTSICNTIAVWKINEQPASDLRMKPKGFYWSLRRSLALACQRSLNFSYENKRKGKGFSPMDREAIEQLDVRTLPFVALEARGTLPKSAAVYFVVSHAHDILYIGRTKNLHMRWTSHHRMEDFTGRDALRIAWLSLPDPSLANDIEMMCLIKFQPLCQAKHPSSMKRINVYLDDDLWHAFRRLCLAQHRSASQAIGALIQRSLAV